MTREQDKTKRLVSERKKLKARAEEMWKEDFTTVEIAVALGIHPDDVDRLLGE